MQTIIVILILTVIIINVLDIEIPFQNPEEETKNKVTDRKPEAPKPPCHARRRFVFIQTHRTASQTQANIMYRAALRYNLIVLPFNGACFRKQGLSHPDCPLSFLADIYYSRLAPPDVFIGDINFNKVAPPLSLMSSDSVLLTSMRSHRKRMESHFSVLKNEDNTTKSPIELTVVKEKQNWHYWTQLCNSSNQYHKVVKKCSVRNDDFRRCVAEACNTVIRDNFEMVTITDYMDESLIMLKRKMCWTHEDIVYSPLNKRKIKRKDAGEKLAKKSEDDEIDQALFKDSNETLWKGIEKENPDFIREAKHLKKIQYVTTQFCGIIYSSLKENISSNMYKVIVSDREVPIPQVRWDSGFKLDPMLCVMIKLKPQVFNNIFIVRMFPEVCKFVPPNNYVSLFGFEIQYDVNNMPIVNMHPAYCSPLQTRYRIPLRILEYPDVYDLEF